VSSGRGKVWVEGRGPRGYAPPQPTRRPGRSSFKLPQCWLWTEAMTRPLSRFFVFVGHWNILSPQNAPIITGVACELLGARGWMNPMAKILGSSIVRASGPTESAPMCEAVQGRIKTQLAWCCCPERAYFLPGLQDRAIQEKNFSSTPWTYFPNGPNAAVSVEPTLIRHCLCRPIDIMLWKEMGQPPKQNSGNRTYCFTLLAYQDDRITSVSVCLLYMTQYIDYWIEWIIDWEQWTS